MTRTVRAEAILFTMMKETEQTESGYSVYQTHLRRCDYARVKSFSVPVFKKMLVPLTWQGVVCVRELLNFCGDSTKNLFEK